MLLTFFKILSIGLSPQRPPEVKVLEEAPTKPRGFNDLDVLGEALLMQNLPANTKPISSFQKPPDRVPLNELAKKKAMEESAQSKGAKPNYSSTKMIKRHDLKLNSNV